MVDAENVIKGLEHCISSSDKNCFRCPYECQCSEGYYTALKEDALALIKEQKKRIDKFELEHGWDKSPDMMGKW